MKWVLYEPDLLLVTSWCQFLKLRYIAREICKNEKVLYVWFRINRENILRHASCLMKWNGLKEEHHLYEMTPKDTKQCLEVMFWSHGSFVSSCFLDLENETFSQHHLHNQLRQFFDFKRFFENFKNGSTNFFYNINHVCLIVYKITFQSFISTDTLQHF